MTKQIKLSPSQKGFIALCRIAPLPIRYDSIVPRRLSNKSFESLLLNGIMTRIEWNAGKSATYILTELGKTISID